MLLGESSVRLTGRPLASLLHPEDRGTLEAALARLASNPGHNEGFRARAADTSDASAVAIAWTIREEGGLLFMVGRKSEPASPIVASYHIAFMASPSDMAVINGETGRIVEVNRHFEANYGLAREKALGRTAEELGLSVDSRLTFLELLRGISDAGQQGAEVELSLPDGRKIPQFIHINRIPLDGVPHYFTGAMDISARKDRDRQVRRLLGFENMLIDLSSMLYGADERTTDTIIQDALREIGTFTGMDRAYLFKFDSGFTVMSNTHEWCAEGISAEKDNLQDLPLGLFPGWMATLMEGREIYAQDIGQFGPDWAAEKEILQAQDVKSIFIVPVSSDTNRFGFLGFDKVREHTEWHADMRRLLRLFANTLATTWTRQAADLSLRLNLAKAEREKEIAARSGRMKSDFLSMMSHEIQTPMNGIVGMTEMLLGTELDTRQRKYFGILKSSADQLVDITRDILEYSRIESGGISAENVPFNPGDTLRNALGPHRREAEAKGLEWELEIDARTPGMVIGDPASFSRIALNLVSNAVKFTEQGKIAVRLGIVQWGTGLCELKLSVSDTGIGVPEEAATRIFEPFEQADETIAARFGGAGLGLAIVRDLCALLGGSVALKGKEGSGSLFECLLPFKVEVAELPRSGSSDSHAARALYDRNANRIASADSGSTKKPSHAVPADSIAGMLASLVMAIESQEPRACDRMIRRLAEHRADLPAGLFARISEIAGLVSGYRFAEALAIARGLEGPHGLR